MPKENLAGEREAATADQETLGDEKEQGADSQEASEALAESAANIPEEAEAADEAEIENLEQEAAEEETAVEEAPVAGAVATEAQATAAATGRQAAAAAKGSLTNASSDLIIVMATPVRFAPASEEKSQDPREAFRGARKRSASEALAGNFVGSNSHHAQSLLDLALTAPDRILVAAEHAMGAIDAAVAENLAVVLTAIDGAISEANERASSAKLQIEVERSQSLQVIAEASQEAREEVTRLFDLVSGELDSLESGQRAAIDGLYAEWRPRFEATGIEVGAETRGIAEGYASGWLSRRNGESTILDGPIHDNRLEARADAARQVGKAYADELTKAANDQAARVVAGKPEALDYVAQSASKAREGLAQHRDQIIQSLDASEKRSSDQVGRIADQMLAGIDSGLAATVATLEQQRAAESSRIPGYGDSQKAAIDAQAGQAIEALLTGAGEAVEAFNESLRGFLASALTTQAPGSAEMSPALAEVQVETDGLAATLLGQLEQGILASEEGVVVGGEQAVSAIGELGQSGAEQAHAASEGYEQSVAQMLAEATKGFANLREGQQSTAGEVRASAESGFNEAAKGLQDAFAGLSTNVVTNFQSAQTELRGSLRESLPKLHEAVKTEAQKAAGQVQPRWKSVVKWVITIAVIVAVVALTIVSAGSLGVVGTILLGTALGAAAGAATTIGHNLVDGKEWSEGVGKAMVIGAIGGAFGGIGGALAGKVASVGLKFAIETGVDAVGGVLGDLAVGNPLTLEGILFGAAIGAGVGAGLGIAGALKGKIKVKTKAEVGSPSVRPTPDVAAPGAVAPKGGADVAVGKPPPPTPKAEAPVAGKGDVAPSSTPKAEIPASKPKPAEGPAPPPKGAAEPAPKGAAEPQPVGKTTAPDDPQLVAQRKTSDGHEIKVTKDGKVVRCTNCELDPYAGVIAKDPKLASRLDDAKKNLNSPDEATRAAAKKEFDELSEELERRLKAEGGQGGVPSKSQSGLATSKDLPEIAGPKKPKRKPAPRQPDHVKWVKDRGSISYDPDGSATFTHKDGVAVKYSPDGHPDFRPHAKEAVEIDSMIGDYYWDFKAANEKAKISGSRPPKDHIWHHHEDGKTMLLVPKNVHDKFPHTGGVSKVKSGS